MFLNWPIPEKIQTGGVETLFWKRTYFFGHFTLGDSRQDEVLPLEIPHYFFLDHAWKFHFFFYWLLVFPHFPHSIFSMPLEILCPPNATHCKRRVANSLVGCSITNLSTWYLHQEFCVTGQYWYRSLSVSLLGRHDHVKIYCTEAFCISFSLTIFDFE